MSANTRPPQTDVTNIARYYTVKLFSYLGDPGSGSGSSPAIFDPTTCTKKTEIIQLSASPPFANAVASITQINCNGFPGNVPHRAMSCGYNLGGHVGYIVRRLDINGIGCNIQFNCMLGGSGCSPVGGSLTALCCPVPSTT